MLLIEAILQQSSTTRSVPMTGLDENLRYDNDSRDGTKGTHDLARNMGLHSI
jgi:hypothetical protein